MALERKKTDDLDKLFEELGVREFGADIEVPKTPEEIARAEKLAHKDEDPYARFLEPKSEAD
ncbi:MAG: hypothetical protein LBI11_04020 [Streptococcaceae bacterium]|jgi:hypothetical protein|nr:hypothetical protein [Streptococcaceae bacterium]